MTSIEGVDFAQAFSGAMWCDIVPRSAVCPELPPHTLLHAGPPFQGAPSAPVMNAAVQALLFEGLAADEAGARRLLADGDAVLEPAQDHGIVTPLAQVVSASMLLGAVTHHAHVAYGALIEGAAPALRFGSAAPRCRERLASLHGLLTCTVTACVRRTPVPLEEVIRRAVAAGDDCHSRTAHANQELLSRLGGLGPADAAVLLAMPAFVLPLLMAGAAAALRHHRCAVGAMGGNGVDFGVRGRGEMAWRRQPALAPVGPASGDAPRSGTKGGGRPGACDPKSIVPDVRAAGVRALGVRAAGLPAPGIALPAIGDSVLVDFCGLGGQVDSPALRSALIDPHTGILDAARIAAGGMSPAFNLAILDAAGELGLIGRGVYHPPAELFAWAGTAHDT